MLTGGQGGCNLQHMLPKDTSSVPALQHMAEWLVGERTQAWLAQQVGVARPTVYRWFKGENAPEPHQRRAIHDLSKERVHFDDWYTDDELRQAYAFSRTRKRRLARRGLKGEE